MKRNRNRQQSSGFTLLEVLIAMFIMVIAFGSIFSIQSSAIQVTNRAKETNTVAMLLKNAMVKAELDVEGKSFEEVKKEEAGSFESPFQDYSWSRKIKELEFPNLVPSAGGEDSQGSQDQSSDLMGKLVTKFLSKAVRQVEVTVKWQKAGREQSVSTSTFWVDLNHEMALSE
ncbi:type II secretion system protein [bacterium]|nr:type II secretion system protein [bacterium]